ncbi:MAG: sterol desaturase family protein [Rhodanobacteraceae bacterium]|nr:sterol desaturase family protein [Rhodanobacteraceae bacterium]
MNPLGPNALIAAIVLPFFYLAVYLDYAISRAQGRPDYGLNDTVASLGVSIMMSAFGVVSIVVRIAIYTLVYAHVALREWSTASPWTWVIGLLLYDFTYYWQHRMGHEWNLLWSSHVVHHSSDRFNLATALRVPSASMHLWTWVFALPLALAGIPPQVYAVASLLNLLYQFWIHTERIGSLAWFDRWFGSPSNHRVHHGVNDRYLDKNYGGILMLWDRMFGTFEDERADDPVRYGTRAPVQSWNPLWINLDTFWALCIDAWRARSWRDKLSIWWRAPGWRPADVAAVDPKPAFELSRHRHFETPTPVALGHYALLQTALLPAQLVHLIAIAAWLPFWPEVAYASYLSVATVALGLLLSPELRWRRVGLALEAARLLLSAGVALSGQWFGQLTLPSWVTWVIVAVAMASLVGLLAATVRNGASDMVAAPP